MSFEEIREELLKIARELAKDNETRLKVEALIRRIDRERLLGRH